MLTGRVGALALIAATPALLASQQSSRPDSARVLPGVTVTATREAAPILSTPLAVTRIGAATLRSASGAGIDDALKLVPGVVAQTRYGTSDVRLIIRGFGARGAGDRSNAGTSRGVRVLLDGIPETEPDGRTAFDAIDLAGAEAVEVIRSNASALWGNAAGGVVNVLTVPGPSAPPFEAQSIHGAFGLARYAVRATRRLGAGTAYASLVNSSFDGWRAHSSSRRSVLNAGLVGIIGDGTRVAFHATGANNLMHVPGPLSPAQAEADARQANAAYLARDERRYNRTLRLGATVEHIVSESTSFQAMVFASPKYLQRSERGTYRDFTRHHVGGSVIGRRTLSPGGTTSRLSVGVDEAFQDGAILFYSLTPQGGRGPTLADDKGEGANNLGVFVQDEIQLGQRARVTLGARYDRLAYYYQSFMPSPPVRRDSRAFTRLTPKVGASWILSPTRSLYANVGGGIEIPAGNETDPTPGSPRPALINPLLEPIRSTTYEAGFRSLAAEASGPLRVEYDVALYDTEIANEIVPYAGGRYYLTAGRARRMGAELGISATTRSGVFGDAALTFSRNRYVEYVVDSAVLGGAARGRADYAGHEVVGVPATIANVAIGMELPFERAVRLKGAMEHTASYFADDANAIRVPSYTIFNATAELRRPILTAAGWGVRGFVTIQNVANRSYVGSAFLNPDRVDGAPAVYEPGTPRSLVVSLSAGRLR